MKKQHKLSIIIIFVLLLLVLIPVDSNAAESISYTDPYPQGTIGIGNPEIGWPVDLNGNKIESALFYINGNRQVVYYDKDREVFYTKLNNYVKGVNTVEARIKLKDWPNIIKYKWSFTIPSNSVSYLPTANTTQISAINYANDYRYLLGNPTYVFDDSLNTAAQKHASYQAINNTFGHYQMPNTVGYFGNTVTERAGYYGFYGDVAEDISYQSNPSVQDAVDSLFDAPYHRIPFLMPSYDYFGYGKSGYYHVINFGSTVNKEIDWVSYPVPNQKNVPISWENYETPNPLRFYKRTSSKVGYPIVVGVYGIEVDNVTLKYAKLWDSSENEVPIYINSPRETGGNDSELTNEVILIPKSPLKEGEKYRTKVYLEANINNYSYVYERTWYFTTEEYHGTGRDKIHQQVAYPPTSKYNQNIQFRLGQKYMWVDNKPYPLDATPYIENGRTMVPFRALGNSLGASVEWNSIRKTIIYKKNNYVIELPANSNKVKINGRIFTIDQGAVVKDGRSYVPSRFISEQLGADVNWIPERQEVKITK